MAELVADVAGPGHPVHLGDERRPADERVEQGQLVADGGEPVVLDEREGHPTGGFGLPAEEHPVPGHEDVVEHRQGLEQLVLRRDRVLERVAVAAAVARDVQGESLGGGRERERDRVVEVVLAHGPGREHDDLVGVGAARRVALGASHDDAVLVLVDDAHVQVGVVLRARALRTIALHVRLRNGEREVVVAAVAVERLDPRQPFTVEDPHQSEEGVGADLVDEGDDGPAGGGSGIDESAPVEQVLRRPRDPVVGGVLLAGLGVHRHGQGAVVGVGRRLVVEGCVVDRDPQVGDVVDVVDRGPLVEERAPVVEGGPVVVGSAQGHGP
jgi:hypothetical protein